MDSRRKVCPCPSQDEVVDCAIESFNRYLSQQKDPLDQLLEDKEDSIVDEVVYEVS